jgi:hypothetical protein
MFDFLISDLLKLFTFYFSVKGEIIWIFIFKLFFVYGYRLPKYFIFTFQIILILFSSSSQDSLLLLLLPGN